MKKKILLVCLVAVLCVSVLATLAYFNAEETTTNEISTGKVDMVLYELDANGNRHDDGMHFESVMPGDTFHKEPVIQNKDDVQSFYTRAKATVSIVNNDGTPMQTQYVSFNIDETKWALGADGWYYYKGIVEPGKTVSLFDTVTISKDMDNAYQNCNITVSIDAQAVQVKNNDVPGGDYTQITGWPATE